MVHLRGLDGEQIWNVQSQVRRFFHCAATARDGQVANASMCGRGAWAAKGYGLAGGCDTAEAGCRHHVDDPARTVPARRDKGKTVSSLHANVE